jgi:hypothetical protein
MKSIRWTCRAALLGTAFAALGALAAPGVQAQTVHAIITDPVGSDRVAALAPRFKTWQQKGLISRMKLLQATLEQPEPPAGFSTLAIVTLPSPSAYRAWRAEADLLLGSGPVVRQATVVNDEGRSGDPKRAIYVANFYAPKVSMAGYQFYTDRYIAPNMDQQRQAGIMSRYTMYLEQGDAARGLLVMEYADEKLLGRRDEVKKQGRGQLMQNAEWKHIDAIKESLRESLPTTLAREFQPAGKR